MSRNNVAIAVVDGMGLFALGMSLGSQSSPSAPPQAQFSAQGLDAWKTRAPVASKWGQDGICRTTPGKLRTIQTGMQLDTVRRVLGCPGELVNAMSVNGRYETHIWRDKDENEVSVTFHNFRAYSVSFL